MILTTMAMTKFKKKKTVIHVAMGLEFTASIFIYNTLRSKDLFEQI